MVSAYFFADVAVGLKCPWEG